MNLSDWRQDYDKYSLKDKDILASPFKMFELWFDKAVSDENLEPNAMVLSTSNNNIPSSRIVLLKEVYENQFCFYTNYNSQKGKEINENPLVSLLFFWQKSQRQVRIAGVVSKINRELSEKYFYSRPIQSQISAIASPQSEIITMQTLIDRVEEVQEDKVLKCPLHWGGYKVEATEMEFWQGQPNRLHDRVVYKKNKFNNWNFHRLAP